MKSNSDKYTLPTCAHNSHHTHHELLEYKTVQWSVQQER